MPIFCNLCNKDFNFEGLPPDRPLFCPDCGSPTAMIDTSELLQKKKNSSNIDSSVAVESSTAVKSGQVRPLSTKRTKTYSHPRYDRRIALVLTSLGVIGIVGLGQIYTKNRKGVIKGICFLIGGFFVYLLLLATLDLYILHPNPEDPKPGGIYGVVFFLIVYILIWLWQFIDLRKLSKYSAQ